MWKNKCDCSNGWKNPYISSRPQLIRSYSDRSLDEWYRVSVRQLSEHAALIKGIPFLAQILNSAYPQHLWDTHKLSKLHGSGKASQRMTAILLKELFPKAGKNGGNLITTNLLQMFTKII